MENSVNVLPRRGMVKGMGDHVVDGELAERKMDSKKQRLLGCCASW
jgi:hypothetical protein